MWNCLWEHAVKRSPGIIRKSRVLYPGPGFLSSATWPSLPKKHYNGLINQSINQINCCPAAFPDCLIGRASLVFILRDVTSYTPLLARLVQ